MKVRVVARIDIKNEFVVKGIQLEGLRKLGNPYVFAKKYYDEGIDEIIFVDVVAAYYDRNSLVNIIKKSSKNIFIPVTVCGGIRTLKDVEELLLCGADRVAINTAVLKNVKFLAECSNLLGAQSVVVSIEAKKNDNDWFCYYNNGRESTKKRVIDWIQEVQDNGVGEILLTSIDKDGTQNGMDIELIKEASKVVKVPLIISGGIGKLEHFDSLKNVNNIDAIAIGSLLHYDKSNVKEVKEYCGKIGVETRKIGFNVCDCRL